MAGRLFSVMVGVSAAALVAASSVAAQSSAPRVRLTTLPNSSVGNISSSISLSEPAYILAVAVDRDGRVSVLSPELPNDVIRYEAAKSIHLPEFFRGFSTATSPYFGGYQGQYYRRASSFGANDVTSGNGSVLVIASRTPLNFAAISEGLFWNEQALEKLIRYRTPSGAVVALGRAVTVKGESFGHDYLYLGLKRNAGFTNAGSCFRDFSHSVYGYAGFGGYAGVSSFYSSARVAVAATANSPGLRLISYGSDECGRPRYVLMPYKLIPPPEKQPDSVITESPKFRSAAAGVYRGDDARRLIESLKSQNGSEGYSRVAMPLVYSGLENGATAGRPVSREAPPGNADQTFERVRSNTRPVERQIESVPVVREQPVQREIQPVTRSEPRVQRVEKVEVVPSTPPPV